MIYQTLKLAVVVAALAVCGNVSAQDCGGCGIANAPQAERGCGRGITQQHAASLWAGYCNENCDYDGGGCDGGCMDCGSRTCGGGCRLGGHGGKLRGLLGHHRGGGCGATSDCGVVSDCGGGCGGVSDCGGCGRGGKLRGLFQGFGSRSGGCGCDMGCFGYPTDCGCDGGNGGGCLAGLRGKLGSRNNCGGGCNMGGKLKGMFSGCGGKMRGLFSRSKGQCGCNGSYFSESVGPEYGTAGMQSCVSGCSAGCNSGGSTGCAGGSSVGMGVMNQPSMPTAEATETVVEEAVSEEAGAAVDELDDASEN